MDVRMPDGVILRGIPDGTPKADIMSRYSASKTKSAGPDPFAGDDLLSRASMQNLSSGVHPEATKQPTMLDSVLAYGKNYLNGLRQAGNAMSQPTNDVPGVGTAETLLSMGSGLVSPIPAAIDSAVLGTSYRQAKEKYTYQPQTQSGQAMAQGVGALTQPLSDVFQYGGKKAGDALSYVPGVDDKSAQEAGAATVDALGLATLRNPLKGPPPTMPKLKLSEVPTTAELKVAKTAAYDQAKNAGVVVHPQSFAKFVDDTVSQLSQEHLNDTLHPGTSGAVTELVNTAKKGAPISLEELDQLRQIVRDAPTGRGDGRMAGKVVKQLDQYIDSLGPKDLVSGDAPGAVSALKQARTLNKRFENSSMFDEMLRKAGINATAKFTQAGEEHALRSEFKKLALNTKKMAKFSDTERQAIENVAKGGTIENAMRDLGKFDPTQGGMSSFIGAATGGTLGMMLGGPEGSSLGLALPAAGYVGRRIATNLTRKNAEAARAALVGRGLPPRGLLGNELSDVGLLGSAQGAEPLQQMLGRR